VKIRVGYELIYDCLQPTPMMFVLNVHYTRSSDILVADRVTTEPSVLLADYRDGFGNWCTEPRFAYNCCSLVVCSRVGSNAGTRPR
jgi:hypothetical protein